MFPTHPTLHGKDEVEHQTTTVEVGTVGDDGSAGGVEIRHDK
jgi:hypothetical protein